MQQALRYLEDGLNNHFTFEEENLPILCGDLLMRAILIDHQEIRDKLHEATSIVSSANLEKLSEDELTPLDSRVKEAITNLLGAVEEHAKKEEVILEMMRRVLQMHQKEV